MNDSRNEERLKLDESKMKMELVNLHYQKVNKINILTFYKEFLNNKGKCIIKK